MAEKNHECAWGCGNIADVVLTNLNDSDVSILCTPCFLRLANDISEAWLKSVQDEGLIPQDEETNSDQGADRSGSGEAPSGADSREDSTGRRDGGSGSTPDRADTRREEVEDTRFVTVAEAINVLRDAGTGGASQCPDCGQTSGHVPGCAFA